MDLNQMILSRRIKYFKGDYICLLDGDDYFHSNKLII